jgi:hypothetical protein
MVSTPRCRRKKQDASPREGRPRLASPPAPARMMKILEAEGGAEAAAGLLLPTIDLVVTILSDHRWGNAAGLPDENP